MDQEYLKSILSYDAGTGEFRWLAKISNKVIVGGVAGGFNTAGYIVIGIGGRTYYAHRLAWIYTTGAAPRQVDHRDGDRGNNRWLNLRPATNQQNVLNSKRAASNTSGFKGVSWHKGGSKWSAYIILDGRKKHLGLHDTPEAAHAAYLAAAKAAQPEFARAA